MGTNTNFASLFVISEAGVMIALQPSFGSPCDVEVAPDGELIVAESTEPALTFLSPDFTEKRRKSHETGELEPQKLQKLRRTGTSGREKGTLLSDPVALALSGGHLFVADNAAGFIFVFE